MQKRKFKIVCPGMFVLDIGAWVGLLGMMAIFCFWEK
jgi:hypothetical protein